MIMLFKRMTRISGKLPNLNSLARAQLLQYLLWIRLLVLLAMGSLNFFLDSQLDPGLWFAFACTIVAILIGKSRRFEFAAYLVIFEQSMAIPAIAIAPNAWMGAGLIAPIFLSVAPVLASHVLSFKETFWTVVITFFAAAVIYLFGHHDYTSLTHMVLLSVIAFSLLALQSAHTREKFETNLEQERAKLAHSSKLASLGDMAAGVAHELNTPLSAIVVSADMILEATKSAHLRTDFVATHAQIISDVSERMGKIIKGLKTFSRDSSTEAKTTVAVREWIHASLRLCQAGLKHCGVEVILEDDHLDLSCEVQPIQLSQALLNLLHNAGEAIADLDEKWIRISVSQTSEWVDVAITDSGAGIGANVLPKIFDPFFSTKDYGRGIGLGLSVSHEIMKRQQGDLFYDRRSPNTCFVMRFPRNSRVG